MKWPRWKEGQARLLWAVTRVHEFYAGGCDGLGPPAHPSEGISSLLTIVGLVVLTQAECVCGGQYHTGGGGSPEPQSISGEGS